MGLIPSKKELKASQELLYEASRHIVENEFIRQMIRAMPYITGILDKNRKIILSNKVKLDDESELSIEEFFGKETGDTLNCIHARKPVEPCEGKGICKYCGLPNAIIRAENSGNKETQETSLSIHLSDNRMRTYDILLTAAPFHYKNHQFILLTINDVSEKNRKRVLERIFFHDILNKTGSLEGIYELLMDRDHQDKREELIELSEEVIKDLNEEILLQKNLMAAESGDLKVKAKKIETTEIIRESVSQVIQYPESQNIKIETSPNTYRCTFISDPIILKRILINMLKNALEASSTNQKVRIGCEKKMNFLVFWVHNNAYIPEQNHIKIFERTYSTKGTDRGIGTYSMKLLGENYLGGKVYFTTDPEKGTTFYFEVPEQNNKKAT